LKFFTITFLFLLIYSPDGGKSASQSKGSATEVEVKEEPMSLATSSQQLSDTEATSDNTGSVAGVGSDVQTRNQVLEALKTRIRELETETRAIGDEKFKCLICMVSTILMCSGEVGAKHELDAKTL
jgi:hypothetical protein